MKKLWLSTLTAIMLVAGLSIGNAAWAGDRHRHHHHHREYRDYGHHHRHHGHHHGHHRYYRPYREVHNVYYVPPPRYYSPIPVYYDGGYGRGYRDSGVRGTISVDF